MAPCSGRGVARLPDDAGRSRRVGRPQNRPDVLRVLDPVQDNEQRGHLVAAHQLFHRKRRQSLQVGSDTLMHASPREPVERHAIDRVHGDPQFLRSRHQRIDARPAAAHVHEPRHAPGLERFGNGIDAEDQRHRGT